jgi:hypothetical protein
VAAKELGPVEHTPRNWVKAAAASMLVGAGAKPVTPEQMELSGLRAENARLKMHIEILIKATAYFARDARQARPYAFDGPAGGVAGWKAKFDGHLIATDLGGIHFQGGRSEIIDFASYCKLR